MVYLNKFDEICKVLLIINCHPIVVVPPYPIVVNLVFEAVDKGQRAG